MQLQRAMAPSYGGYGHCTYMYKAMQTHKHIISKKEKQVYMVQYSMAFGDH